MSTINEFALAVSRLVPALGIKTFAQQLTQELLALTGAEDGSVLIYSNGHLPTVAYNSPTANQGASGLDTYLKGPFLLDPYYRAAAMDHRFGVFRLQELAPKGFKDSEYYRAWYRNHGFEDECGLLIALSDESNADFLNIALGFTHEGQRFSKRQTDLLTAIFPTIEALCRQHWNRELNSSPQIDLRAKLHGALSNFGSSMLTKREQEVTELVLLGNSTKLIAEKLGISTETVKLHRKHAYAKLDVSSQAELFYLFMEALSYSLDSGAADPLLILNSKPA